MMLRSDGEFAAPIVMIKTAKCSIIVNIFTLIPAIFIVSKWLVAIVVRHCIALL